MKSKYKLDKIIDRINKLNIEGIKVILDMIVDTDKGIMYFKIKAVNRFNEIIEQEDFTDIPREYLDKYYDKYKTIASVDIYKIINGKMIPNKL